MPDITELWAWVSSDEGGEGVLAAPVADGMLSLPLVGADRDRMLSYAPVARQMANMFGVEVKLIRFTNRVEVERISPVVKNVDLPDMPEGMPERMKQVVDNELAAARLRVARKEHDERPE